MDLITESKPIRDLSDHPVHEKRLPKLMVTKLPSTPTPRAVPVKVQKLQHSTATKVPYGMVPLIKDSTPRIPTVYTG
jgi:hypothetical protein